MSKRYYEKGQRDGGKNIYDAPHSRSEVFFSSGKKERQMMSDNESYRKGQRNGYKQR